MDLTQYIRAVPDFPKPGILFRDITPLLGNSAAFRAAIEAMAEHYRGTQVDVVVSGEPMGCQPAIMLWNMAPTHSKSTATGFRRAKTCCWSMICWPPAARSRPAADWSRNRARMWSAAPS